MDAVSKQWVALFFAAALAACGGGGGGGGGDVTAVSSNGGGSAGPAPAPAPVSAPAPGPDSSHPPAPARRGFDPVLVVQDVAPQTPALARLTTGGKVIAWATEGGRRVWAQKTTAAGELVGSPIAVNTPNGEVVPGFSVAAGPDGGFAVAYAMPDEARTSPFSVVLGIQLRRYANDGTLLSDTRVNDPALSDISSTDGRFFSVPRGPVIRPVVDGSFVVGWNAQPARPAPVWSYLQRVAADGSRVGPQVFIGGNLRTDQLTPVPLTDATVVAVWQQEIFLPTGVIYRIFNQRFGKASKPLSPATEYAGTLGRDLFPIGAAALKGGNVALAWAGPDDGANPRTVFSTIITPDGSSAATITQTPGPKEEVSDIAVVPLGSGFGTLWQSTAGLPRGEISRIGVRRFDGGGFAVDAPSLLVERPTFTASPTTGESARAGTGFTAVGGHDGNLIAIYQQANRQQADAYLVAR